MSLRKSLEGVEWWGQSDESALELVYWQDSEHRDLVLDGAEPRLTACEERSLRNGSSVGYGWINRSEGARMSILCVKAVVERS
jgi:hypothetical protein